MSEPRTSIADTFTLKGAAQSSKRHTWASERDAQSSEHDAQGSKPDSARSGLDPQTFAHDLFSRGLESQSFAQESVRCARDAWSPARDTLSFALDAQISALDTLRCTRDAQTSALETFHCARDPQTFAHDAVSCALDAQSFAHDAFSCALEGLSFELTVGVRFLRSQDVISCSAGRFFDPGSVESDIAIANTGAPAPTVNLDFTIVNGAASTAHASIAIPGGGQFTGFLKQIPGFENLPSPLQGIMRVSSADGIPASTLVMAVIRGRYNERGDFLFSSAPPVPTSPSPADAELEYGARQRDGTPRQAHEHGRRAVPRSW